MSQNLTIKEGIQKFSKFDNNDTSVKTPVKNNIRKYPPVNTILKSKTLENSNPKQRPPVPGKDTLNKQLRKMFLDKKNKILDNECVEVTPLPESKPKKGYYQRAPLPKLNLSNIPPWPENMPKNYSFPGSLTSDDIYESMEEAVYDVVHN